MGTLGLKYSFVLWVSWVIGSSAATGSEQTMWAKFWLKLHHGNSLHWLYLGVKEEESGQLVASQNFSVCFLSILWEYHEHTSVFSCDDPPATTVACSASLADNRICMIALNYCWIHPSSKQNRVHFRTCLHHMEAWKKINILQRSLLWHLEVRMIKPSWIGQLMKIIKIWVLCDVFGGGSSVGCCYAVTFGQ